LISKNQWLSLEEDLVNYSKGHNATLFDKGKKPDLKKERFVDPLTPKTGHQGFVHNNTFALGERNFAYKFFDIVIDEKGKRWIGLYLREITEEKILYDQWVQAEKLSGLRTLATGIAHEINNPLQTIMAFTEGILGQTDISKVKKLAEKVLYRAKCLASIVRNLSGHIGSLTQEEPKNVNVVEQLDAAVQTALLEYSSKEIELKKNFTAFPTLKAKPEEIQQIFFNITCNALQAMEGKGRLNVSSEHTHGEMILKIQDTGPGIPEEHLLKVFDPFFTTKEPGAGTGLGLNMAYRLVEKYGGRIDIRSTVEEGNTFVITFPDNSK